MTHTGAALEAELDEILYSEAQIAEAVRMLAERIALDYEGNPLLLVGVMKGALFFMADFARALSRVPNGPSEITLDILVASSYGASKQSSGIVRLQSDVTVPIEGRHVLIVEDVVDQGHTVAALQRILGGRSPASLRTCVLFDKPARRVAEVSADYVGFTCPDAFIVGYGLDYQEKYRNLPYVATLRP
jgi:hypoxanthine phosphoribosyltransferase